MVTRFFIMFRQREKYKKRNSSAGQNMTEYILVFVAVVVTLVVALNPSGFLTQKMGDTVNRAMVGTKCLALKTCFDPAGCPTVCGNDCCEPGESVSSCPADCTLCMSDAQCDDGIACNGVHLSSAFGGRWGHSDIDGGISAGTAARKEARFSESGGTSRRRLDRSSAKWPLSTV